MISFGVVCRPRWPEPWQRWHELWLMLLGTMFYADMAILFGNFSLICTYINIPLIIDLPRNTIIVTTPRFGNVVQRSMPISVGYA